jgi:hypothetical protein
MKSLLLATAGWLFLSAPPADELKRDRLPADVDFVVHLDLEGFKQTELFKQALSKGDMDFDLDELGEIEEEFGIDPLTDVRAVTLFKVKSEEDPTVVLFSSTDKVDQALERLKREGGYHPVHSGGIHLHTWGDDGDDGERMFAYVHAPAGAERVVVLASNEASALRAARVLRGEEASHARAGTLLTLAPTRGSFLYVAAAEIPGLDDFTPASQVIGLAQGIQLDLAEAGGYLRAHMGVTTGSPEDALNISSVANGLISLAKLAGAEAGEALELLTGLRLNTRGSEVMLDFEFEVQRLLEILAALDEDDDDWDDEGDEDVRIQVK